MKILVMAGVPQRFDDTAITFSLRHKRIFRGRRRVQLSPQEFRLVMVMMVGSANGYSFTTADLIETLYGEDDRGGPDNPARIVYIRLCSLRRRLARIDLRISRNSGWRYFIAIDPVVANEVAA